MGISIDIHIYNKSKLIEKLKKWGADNDELTMKILEKCGSFFGDKYILLNNELWDGYSPYYNVTTLLDSAYKKEKSFDIFLFNGDEGINAVELYEVADELGIEIIEDD